MTRTLISQPSVQHLSPWIGMVPIEDTALAVTDSGGTGQVIVYLNGAFGTQKDWKPVIQTLGQQAWRHITFDERARGKSKQSKDYSFESCVRDVAAVLNARGVNRAILVGWSLGGEIAMHWADRFPERTAGVVAVDGGIPYGLTGEEGRARLRSIFTRVKYILPVASLFGLAARMSADQHADVNIEANEVGSKLAPVLSRLTRPVNFVLATGAHIGTDEEEMKLVRASLDPVLAVNTNVRVSARVPSNHGTIVNKDYNAIAQAIREVALLAEHG